MSLTKITPSVNIPAVPPTPPISGYTYCPQPAPGGSPNPPNPPPSPPPPTSGSNGGSSTNCITIYIPPTSSPNNPNQNENGAGTYEVICP